MSTRAGPVQRLLVFSTPANVSPGGRDTNPEYRPDQAWVWRSALDGRKKRRLTHGLAPAVSPDGRWIAFLRERRDGTETEIDVISSRGGRTRRLRSLDQSDGVVFRLVWAPDSQRVLTLGSRILSVSLDGKTLVVDPDGAGWISFSPDGSSFAYTKSIKTPSGSYASDLYVTSLSGGPPRRVTNDGIAYQPAWGPAGIASPHGDGDLWLVQPDGSELRRLTTGQLRIIPVAWSRDGRRLLAENPPHHNGRLWAVDGETGSARPLTPWVGGLEALAVSADGRTILATTGHGGQIGCGGVIETIPYAGGRPRVLLRHMCNASWNG